MEYEARSEAITNLVFEKDNTTRDQFVFSSQFYRNLYSKQNKIWTWVRNNLFIGCSGLRPACSLEKSSKMDESSEDNIFLE